MEYNFLWIFVTGFSLLLLLYFFVCFLVCVRAHGIYNNVKVIYHIFAYSQALILTLKYSFVISVPFFFHVFFHEKIFFLLHNIDMTKPRINNRRAQRQQIKRQSFYFIIKFFFSPYRCRRCRRHLLLWNSKSNSRTHYIVVHVCTHWMKIKTN